MPEVNKNISVEGGGHLDPIDDVVLSKGAWREEAEREYREAERKSEPLTVIFVDVNYFKSINDTFGHEVGDKVIADVRNLMNILVHGFRIINLDQERKLDVVSVSEARPPEINREPMAGHIGGDEFAVIARTDSAGAQIIIQRLRALFDQYINDPAHSRLQELGIGLAIGAASTDEGAKGVPDLLRRADLNMYENKLSDLDLSEHQKKAVRIAWVVLKEAGVRIRDVPKIIRMHPELFDDADDNEPQETLQQPVKEQVSLYDLPPPQREILIRQALERDHLRQRQIEELKAAGLEDLAAGL